MPKGSGWRGLPLQPEEPPGSRGTGCEQIHAEQQGAGLVLVQEGRGGTGPGRGDAMSSRALGEGGGGFRAGIPAGSCAETVRIEGRL